VHLARIVHAQFIRASRDFLLDHSLSDSASVVALGCIHERNAGARLAAGNGRTAMKNGLESTSRRSEKRGHRTGGMLQRARANFGPAIDWILRHASPAVTTPYALKVAAFVAALCVLPSPSFAQGGQDEETRINTDWTERLPPNWDIDPHDQTLLGDSIDPHTGQLSFAQVDVSIPGNSHLEVAVRRRRNPSQSYWNEFKDWQLVIPSIKTNIPDSQWNTARWGAARCSQPLASSIPPGYYGGLSSGAPLPPSKYSHGVVMDIPGQGTQQLLDNPNGSSWPSNAEKVTVDGWYFTCLSNIDGAGTEGFYAYAPNGDRYRFDTIISRRRVSRFESWDVSYFGGSGTPVVDYYEDQMSYDVLAASEVTDADGNWVRYEFDTSERLVKIHANDGRRIDFIYIDSSIRIAEVVANQIGRASCRERV